MLHLQQELILIIQDTSLDLDLILHQFPPPFRSTSSNNNFNDNPQTSNRYYDPFNYNFYPPSNTTNNTNTNQHHSQINTISTTQNPFIQLSNTNTSQNIYPQNQGTSYTSTSYSNITQDSQRRLHNPPLTHIPTDPLYQTHPNPNPNPNPLPPNTIQHIPPPLTQQLTPPPQYLLKPQDTFINLSASIPEPMKPFDGLDHSYTPEEYLQQVEARLTFAIGEEPQNNPIKYKSWHNRRMAYIQCSLTGTALDWYTNLHISYKQQWNSFVQLFKKQFSSQKTAYYAQVEAMSLMKKDNETDRHFALRVQQLVKKGWCNENAATINLKNNEIFTKGLPKKLKDFAHKRQVKRVSTLLEPSNPFHTLVRHVDSEDIANEKIRTNDLALEINKVSLKDDTNKKEFEHENQIMVTQSGDPNNKSKPAYKNIIPIVTKIIIVFQIVIKNNVMTNTRNTITKDQELLNNTFYNIFAVNLIILKKIEMTIQILTPQIMIVINIIKITIVIDTETMIEIVAIVENIRKTTIDQTLDKDIIIDPEVRLDLDLIILIKEELHLDLHIDLHTEITQITDIILTQDTDLVLNHKETPSNDIIIHIHLHQDLEILDQDLEHPQETDNKTE